ncbi:sugar ABC transporter ATP-binding protein [Nocardioides marmoribigeumensis]|uniref:Ribose transport system ATP-binding protein n=1 Tax=Nocardioides marmoribigeumensis TaxID=433649 RepID=A0ABU2BT30_9ACTN|nr:sugar ABC transporter ATP-binding protein [Nocardioides marmoribigeumensis]MDR7361794.1 ribose transport system ATP-binding protein [Nocardioides marmoribigeumensis]
MTTQLFAHGTRPDQDAPALRLTGVSKSFSRVTAVQDITLEIKRNQVVGLIGENGAGKSSLLKILTGIYQPDSGTIEVLGKAVKFRRPQDSVAAGIGVVHQEQSLLTNLSVAENIAMNAVASKDAAVKLGWYRWKRLNQEAAEVLSKVGSTVDPRTVVGDLPFVDRQMVEIARALRVDEHTHASPLVILDEPTAVLERDETAILEREIRALRELGSVIFVSHRLDEVMRVCDRILVMRQGRLVADRATSDVTQEELFQLMVGHAQRSPQRSAPQHESETPALEIEGLGLTGTFRDVSLTVHPGQCVALVGTIGSGREEVCRAVFGAGDYDTGTVRVDGKEIRHWRMGKAVRSGVAYVPAERKTEGMVGGLSGAENLTLAKPGAAVSGPLLRPRARKRLAEEWFETLDVRPRDPDLHLERFSGGNQQKVVMAKWLMDEDLKVLVLDHPLRGLDAGAAETVNEQIQAACARGTAVLLIADTIEDALESAHVVVVMRDGEVTATYDLSVESATSLDLLERMV